MSDGLIAPMTGMEGKNETLTDDRIDGEENKVAIFGIGGGGVNQVGGLLDKLDPALHPHILCAMANTDWPQVNLYVKPAGGFPKESMLPKWLAVSEKEEDRAKAQLVVLRLGELAAGAGQEGEPVKLSTEAVKVKVKEPKRGQGAGQDPAVGRRRTLESQDEIRKFVKRCSILFIVTGLGGGTGTGGTEVVVDIALEEGVDCLVIATMPLAIEGGKKTVRAIAARAELLKKCTVITVYNQNVANHSVTFEVAWKLIDDSCVVPLLDFLHELVLTVAKGMNFDPSDLQALLRGKFGYYGHYLGKRPSETNTEGAKDMDAVVTCLLENPYQDKRTLWNANNILVWLRGSEWTMADAGKIVEGLQKARTAAGAKVQITPEQIEFKFAIDNVAKDSWIALLASAEIGPDGDMPQSDRALASDKLAAITAGSLPAGNGFPQTANTLVAAGSTAPLYDVKFFVKGKPENHLISGSAKQMWDDLSRERIQNIGQYSKVEEVIQAIRKEINVTVDPPEGLLIAWQAMENWRSNQTKKVTGVLQ